MHATTFPKENIRILLLEGIHPLAVQRFADAGYPDAELVKGALPEADLCERIRGVHLLGIRSKTRLTPRVLEAADRLLGVGAFCIGTDQIDLGAAAERGVAVFNAPFSNTRSVAELTLAALILLLRRIPEKAAAAAQGLWLKDAGGSRELRGKTLGIVGYGNIGMQVGVLAEALGMTVLYHDIVPKLPLGNARPAGSLEALLQAADAVTLHVPDTPLTRNLINDATLARFKPGAVLINHARGGIVDLDAAAGALRSGSLAGMAADVFPDEPERSGDAFRTPLQGLPNVLLTPHIGGSTEEAQERIGDEVAGKLLQFLEWGQTLGSLTVPPVSLQPGDGAHRILHVHRNIPGVLGELNSALSAAGLNVQAQHLATREAIGYAVMDVDQPVPAATLAQLRAVRGTVRARLVR